VEERIRAARVLVSSRLSLVESCRAFIRLRALGAASEARLVDAENGEVREVSVDAEVLRSYERQLGTFISGIEGFCRANELNYVRVVSDMPVEDLLLRRLKGGMLQ
jgi:hypothetical protein